MHVHATKRLLSLFMSGQIYCIKFYIISDIMNQNFLLGFCHINYSKVIRKLCYTSIKVAFYIEYNLVANPYTLFKKSVDYWL